MNGLRELALNRNLQFRTAIVRVVSGIEPRISYYDAAMANLSDNAKDLPPSDMRSYQRPLFF